MSWESNRIISILETQILKKFPDIKNLKIVEREGDYFIGYTGENYPKGNIKNYLEELKIKDDKSGLINNIKETPSGFILKKTTKSQPKKTTTTKKTNSRFKSTYMQDKRETTDDSVILSNVLEALDITANKLKTKMGYASSSSIYHILKGVNKISADMARRLVEVYPQVNFLYLTQGKQPVLLNDGIARGQSNFFSNPNDKLGLEDMPQLLMDIKNLLQEVVQKLDERK